MGAWIAQGASAPEGSSASVVVSDLQDLLAAHLADQVRMALLNVLVDV